MTESSPDQQALAARVEERVLTGPGLTSVELRQAAAAPSLGGSAPPTPYEALARQIAGASHRVTDEQVAAVVSSAGSQKAAFEIVAAASVGAGLLRWSKGMNALREAIDAA